MNTRIVAAEGVGTFILMIGGPGSAVLAADSIGRGGVALAFGFSLLIAAYIVGPVSGCHINPAVTVGLAIMRKIEASAVAAYVTGQVVGAVVGGGVIYTISEMGDGDPIDNTGILATNGYTDDFADGLASWAGIGPTLVVEIVFTGLLVLAVLATTAKAFPSAVVWVHVGITLALIHLVTIPIDNTSVNPARSLGVAVFEGGDALAQLWAFIVFPLIGAVVGAVLWMLVSDEDGLDQSLLADAT